MQIKCNEDIIEVDDIIASSVTLQNMMIDTEINEMPIIPSKYYDQLKTKIEPFETVEFRLKLIEFMKTNSELIKCDETKTFFGEINIKDLTLKLIDDLNLRITMLEFYYFLEVDHDVLNILAKQIGIILEQVDIDIEIIPELLSMIIKQYPSLCYHTKYRPKARQLHPKLAKEIIYNAPRYASSYYIRQSCLKYEIQQYCYGGNYEHVKYLFELGGKFDINLCFWNACHSGNLKLVQFILSLGAKITNYLIICCPINNIEILKFLIDNFSGKIYFDRLLEKSCQINNVELVKYLVSKGADLYSTSALLHCACYGDNTKLDMIKYLIENKYDINQQPKGYDNIVIICKNNVEIVHYLYRHGLNIHIDDDLPLRLACEKGYSKLCEYLISTGSNVHANNDECLINCIYGINNRDVAIFRLLVENGVDINRKWAESFIISLINSKKLNGNPDIVYYILEKDMYSCFNWVRETWRHQPHDFIIKRQQYYADLILYLRNRKL